MAACNHDCAKPETKALDEMAERWPWRCWGHGLVEALVLDAGKVGLLRMADQSGESRAACEEIAGSGVEGVVVTDCTQLWGQTSNLMPSYLETIEESGIYVGGCTRGKLSGVR